MFSNYQVFTIFAEIKLLMYFGTISSHCIHKKYLKDWYSEKKIREPLVWRAVYTPRNNYGDVAITFSFSTIQVNCFFGSIPIIYEPSHLTSRRLFANFQLFVSRWLIFIPKPEFTYWSKSTLFNSTNQCRQQWFEFMGIQPRLVINRIYLKKVFSIDWSRTLIECLLSLLVNLETIIFHRLIFHI